MAHGKSLELRDIGSKLDTHEYSNPVVVNESGTKKENPFPNNRRRRRAMMSQLRKLIRRQKKLESSTKVR